MIHLISTTARKRGVYTKIIGIVVLELVLYCDSPFTLVAIIILSVDFASIWSPYI